MSSVSTASNMLKLIACAVFLSAIGTDTVHAATRPRAPIPDYVINGSDGLPPGALVPADGINTRHFMVFTPTGAPAENRACVLVLHGSGSNGISAARTQSRFEALAESQPPGEGFLVIFPESVEDAGPRTRYTWNDGRNVTTFNLEEGSDVYNPDNPDHDSGQWSEPVYSQENNVDDVGYLETVINILLNGSPDGNPGNIFACDAGRIYMTGPSSGGNMTQRFLVERPGIVAAAGAVVADLPYSLATLVTTPVPILLMLGQQDTEQRYFDWDVYDDPPYGSPPWTPLIPSTSPHEGGWSSIGLESMDCSSGSKAGRLLTAAETLNFWAAANGCTESGTQVLLGNSTTVSSFAEDCTDGKQVLLYTVGEGGHSWPGNNDVTWPACVGPPFQPGVPALASDDFIAEAELWDFWKSYPIWQPSSVQQCIHSQSDQQFDHAILEGFWRAKLHTSSALQDTAVTIQLRGTDILPEYPLIPGMRLIARLYPDQSPPPAYGPGSGWDSNIATVEGTPEDPVVKVQLSDSSGSTEQWLELIVPDYDLDDDGFINFSDLGIFKGHFFTSDPEYDFDRDGFVNTVDLGMMKQVFFMTGPCGGQQCQVGDCPDYPSR